MNLRVLKRSNKQPVVGDIFTFQLLDDVYYFGKVISTSAKIGPMTECILVYLYKTSSPKKNQVPNLLKSDLMVAPLMTNKLPWTKGYFEKVSHADLTKFDVLPLHVFRDIRGLLFDDHGNPVGEKQDIVGEYGLQSYRTIDDKVSEALGIPLSV